jgi:hypothetical protein
MAVRDLIQREPLEDAERTLAQLDSATTEPQPFGERNQ